MVRGQSQESQTGQKGGQGLPWGSRAEVRVKNRAEHWSPEATLEGDPGAVTGY